MSEEQERLLREGDGFLSSQVSFDLEGPRKPVRRKSKKDDSEKTSKKRLADEQVTECPGCAAEIPEGDFVLLILSNFLFLIIVIFFLLFRLVCIHSEFSFLKRSLQYSGPISKLLFNADCINRFPSIRNLL